MTRAPWLDRITIASPCTVGWDTLDGGERVRYCGVCDQNVYNLSGMSRSEAQELVAKADDGRVCVRFFRRQDGTVLTSDCPVGRRTVQRRRTTAGAGAAAVLSLVAGGVLGWRDSAQARPGKPLPTVDADPPFTPLELMGEVAHPHEQAGEEQPVVEMMGAPLPPEPVPEELEELMGDVALEEHPEVMGRVALPPQDQGE